MRIVSLASLLSLLVLAASCNLKSTSLLPENEGPGKETIAIVGTNDIHGTLAPLQLRTREPEGTPSIDYQAGGVAYLASYINILRDKTGPRLLWLDGGDEFQGSIESNTEKGAPMVQFFNAAGLSGAAIGNHEFDFGPENDPPKEGSNDLLGALRARLKEAKYPYLAANIVDRATGEHAPFDNAKTRTLYTVGGLKVGVFGLSTLDTPTTTRSTNIKSLSFEDLKTATLREAEALRKDGAQIVVLTSHVGLKCEKGKAPSGNTLRKSSDLQGECGDGDEMVRLLRSIPTGTIDAVVAGHSHQIVHHWVANTPVIQGGANGRYFNVIYLTYDWNQKKLLSDRTRIEGPVPVCPLVFQNQNDCNGDRPAPSNGRGPLVQAKYKGEKIEADSAIQKLLEPVYARSAAKKAEPVAVAARSIDHDRSKESHLGILFADSLREAAKSDVAIMNAGGIRASIEQGPITYGTVFRAMPFDNAVSKLTLTGKELKLMLRIAESGSRGFFPVSGLKLKVIDPAYDAPSSDLDGDKKTSVWEINRLVEAKLADGKPIQDDANYTVATIDFLVTGGDDMGWFMKQIPDSRKELNVGIFARDALVAHLKGLALKNGGPINSVEHPVYDAQNPRFTFVKSEKGKPGKKRRHKKSSRKAKTG